MTWYSFTAEWPDNIRSGDAGTTRLSDDSQARHFAMLLVRELRERAEYKHPGLRMIVRNAEGDVVHVISF
jgi:Domain of unknown function (DUF6894)